MHSNELVLEEMFWLVANERQAQKNTEYKSALLNL